MEKIANLDIYNDGMRKSMADKLFFTDLIKDDTIDTIVDYGCADGTLLSMVDNWKKIGVDMNLDMILRAQELCPTAKFILANNLPIMDGTHKILNLSSVLHEIYSYGTKDEVFTFWKNMFTSNYDYIVIRDLITDVESTELASDYEVKIIREMFPNYVASFESIWGSIDYQKNLLHFLLKCRYTENWNREVKENYFNLSVKELLKLIPNGYEVFYQNTYCLPFVHDSILALTEIDIQNTTHIQLILKRIK